MPNTQRHEPAIAGVSPRFLLVDDSEDDALLVELQLRKLYSAAEFARVDRPQDMKRELAAAEWDLLISDDAMPSFDSKSALRVLRASGQDIPFIIYSGQLAESAGISAMHIGASDFVEKSAPARLLAVVERELHNLRLRREKVQAERSASELTCFDPLTTLPNRMAFAQAVTARLNAGGAGRAALVHLDLDRFMRINDSIGYEGGDVLLHALGERLATWQIGTAEVARLGHEEFGVFIDGVENAAAAEAQARAALELFAAPLSWEGREILLTATIGVAVYPEHGRDAATLLKNAESACVAAEKLGVNRFETYRNELNNGASLRLRLESDLRHAVERNELYLQYQPIFDLGTTRRMVGTEALVRWRHPELGLVVPDQFIGIADETGLIGSIGEWVLRTACAQTRAWHEAGFSDLRVAVNFSGVQFNQMDITGRVVAVLAAGGLLARYLDLEITETVAMRDAEATIQTLRRFTELGVRISIDDFGTGYSSLAYLQRFPINILKIDRSFLGDLREGSEAAAIVHTVVALGHALKLRVVAEGVETAAQVEFLAAEGCDAVQGYYFSRPLDAEAVRALLVTGATGVLAKPAIH